MQSSYRTPEWLLEQWGIWSKINKHPRHTYPHHSAHVTVKGGLGHELTDEEAQEIDKIITELFHDSRAQHRVMMLYYTESHSIRGVKDITGQSTSQIHGLLDSGRSWFKGRVRGVRTLTRMLLPCSNTESNL